MTYKLKLEFFEGPLDLLLYLIKKDDIDIFDIPIAEITQQYLQYIELMEVLNYEIVGDFLVMAATLMQIKSKMLLPPDPSEQAQNEIDPRAELVRRLQEYKMFKEIAEDLQGKESQRQDFFQRRIDQQARYELVEDAKEVYWEVSLLDLINAFSKILERFKDKKVYEVQAEEYTIEQKIHEILHTLLERPKLFFSDLFTQAKSKNEIIVSFIAILELIRLKEVSFVQKDVFGEIEVMRNKINLIPVNDGRT